MRKQLNSEVDIVRVENGAYRPFKKTLSALLTKIVSSISCFVWSMPTQHMLPKSNCRSHHVMRYVLLKGGLHGKIFFTEIYGRITYSYKT